jgi:hypothetical protein
VLQIEYEYDALFRSDLLPVSLHVFINNLASMARTLLLLSSRSIIRIENAHED